MKKALNIFIAIMLVLCMVFSLAGCGNKEMTSSEMLALTDKITLDASTITVLDYTRAVETEAGTYKIEVEFKAGEFYHEKHTMTVIEGTTESTTTACDIYLVLKDGVVTAYQLNEDKYEYYTFESAEYLDNVINNFKEHMYDEYADVKPDSNTRFISTTKKNTTYRVIFGDSKIYTVEFSTMAKMTEVFGAGYRICSFTISQDKNNTTKIVYEYPTVTGIWKDVDVPADAVESEKAFEWLNLPETETPNPDDGGENVDPNPGDGGNQEGGENQEQNGENQEDQENQGGNEENQENQGNQEGNDGNQEGNEGNQEQNGEGSQEGQDIEGSV